MESLVLAQWATFPYWPPSLTTLGEAEAGVYGVLMPFSPLLLMGFLYGRLLVYGVARIRGSKAVGPTVASLVGPVGRLVRSLRSVNLDEALESAKILQHPRLMLALAVASSAILAFMPYRPDINASGSLVGIDSPLYQDWLSQMLSRPFPDAIEYAFAEAALGSRPLFLIPLYLISLLQGIQPGQVVEALPIALGPILSATSFLFVRSGQGSERLAGLTAVLTAFSFNFTVGMWGGYYANWLALAEAYLFLTVLLSFPQYFSLPKFAALMGLSLAILLTHPWTWVLVLTVSLVFSISITKETKQHSYTWIMVTVILAGLTVDFLKNWTFGPRTVAEDLATKTSIAGIHELVVAWPNIIDSLLFTHGGLLANSLLLALAVVPLVTLSFQDRFQRLLIIWILTAGIPLSFLDSYHQARMIYDLPMPILAALGLLLLVSPMGKGKSRWPGLIILLTILFSANYALRAMLQL